ncbi:MAG TPA: hypothetical protein VM782_24330, partial [Stellaceae bacterium]|nr:hypothetical protein [Stellaceae bacterium]
MRLCLLDLLEQSPEIALVGRQQFVNLEQLIRRQRRPLPNCASMKLQLKLEHRSTVLGVHFVASSLAGLLISAL